MRGASQDTVDDLAIACARKLAAWFGSEEEAIKALTEDPLAMVALVLAEQQKTMDAIKLKIHMEPRPFFKTVYHEIKRTAP